MKNSFLILLVFFVISCDRKKDAVPDGILKKETMIAVLADIHIAEASIMTKGNYGQSDSLLPSSYYKFVFNRYKISPDQFRTSFDYYSSHPELFSEVYKGVLNELSKRHAETEKK